MKIVTLGLVILVMAAVVLSAGCSNSPGVNTDPDKIIRVKVGEEFKIELSANPTAGYDWEYTGEYEWIELMDKTYEADNPGLTGSGGIDTFTFKADAKGTADLDFVYQRAWESEPIERKTFTVECSGE